jgi:lipopolysaccharide/colanic/teichoic acid biosynthesis glycosyltransferase
MIKRMLDILISLAALAILAVPLLLIALAIRLGSPGPALFRQQRVGWRGKPFTLLKFRTMRADVDPYGQSPRGSGDTRLTSLGRFLRERSLDELPQLLNVLAGQMSLVGPRPLYLRQAQVWTDRQKRRLLVRPGLTGYAQIRGRGELTHEEKIELDLHYVDNRSLGMDVKILCKTIVAVFTRRRDTYERCYSRDKEREND